MLALLRSCLALCILLTLAGPAFAEEVTSLLLAEIGPGSPAHEYRFPGTAGDVVSIYISTLAEDVEVEIGRGEGPAFRHAPGYYSPAKIITISLTETGAQVLRVNPPKALRRYLIRLLTPRKVEVTPLHAKTLTEGPATAQRQVVRIDAPAAFELKASDPPDPDFAVPHHVLRIEGPPNSGVVLQVSSSNLAPGVIHDDFIRRNKWGPVDFQVPLDGAGRAEVRVVPTDSRLTGRYAVTVRKDPYFVPPKKYSEPARPFASTSTAAAADGPGALGKYKELVLRLECGADRSWAGSSTRDLGNAQPKSACGTIPFGHWVVWVPPTWYVWKTNTRARQERLGDPTIGMGSERDDSGCIACDRKHQDCLRECNIDPRYRTALCVSLCDRPHDTCRSRAHCDK